MGKKSHPMFVYGYDFSSIPLSNGSLPMGLYSLSGKTSYRSKPRYWVVYDRIVLKFDWYLGTGSAEMPDKFKSGWKSLSSNLAASSLREIL